MKPLVIWGLLWGLTVPLGALGDPGLQDRIDRASANQVLVVAPGDYRGPLVVRRSITLRGGPGVRLVREPGTQGPTLWVQAPGVRVEGWEIEGSGEGTRRDHTAVVVTAPGVRLSQVTIRQAWAGVWIDHADGVTLRGVTFQGLVDYPFWERGEGIRVTNSARVTLDSVVLDHTGDGVFLEKVSDARLEAVEVSQARYGLHLMFTEGGTAQGVRTRATVAGLMVMESSLWTIRASTFLEGYSTGSAGVREIRTKGIRIEGSTIGRHSSGIELLDARDGLLVGNRIEENATAWTWGGDNSGTLATGNFHRANLRDAAGTEPREADWVGTQAHQHGTSGLPTSPVAPSSLRTRPTFDLNLWDSWHGLDLDHDGRGDTPHRFDPDLAAWSVLRPWAGIFLGSPWSGLIQALPGGEVLDPRPLSREPVANAYLGADKPSRP